MTETMPPTPLAHIREALAENSPQEALDVFLSAEPHGGHKADGYVVERLPDGREMPLCVNCGRPSRIVQRQMRELG